jgi:hypothetical protein
MSAYADAIAAIESGGNYGAQGPVTKSGDRAYGKYQVMGANIPEWTREVLGVSLTPEEFLASPEAQDAVFEYRFGRYADQYGPAGAASMWFTGSPTPKGRSDGYTLDHDYVSRFMDHLGQEPEAGNANALEAYQPPLPQQPRGNALERFALPYQGIDPALFGIG